MLVKSIDRLLAGKPLPDYSYRDFGSLVSLSERNAVGNLMGNLTGDVFVSGRIARLIYKSLYRMHLLALYGYTRTAVKVVSQWLSGSLRPTMKMH